MEIAVMSGKGGTGKTTLAVSLSYLFKNSTKIDCDVDASNMFMFYEYDIEESKDMLDANVASIDSDKCVKCGKCVSVCKYDAIKDFKVDEIYCEGCKACYYVCDFNAIEINKDKIAVLNIANGDESRLVYANMEVGADGSGKIVTSIKKEAKAFNTSMYVSDGSPGTGCQVMATITDCDLILLVTEPSKSGLSDALRLIELAKHFEKKVVAVINKADINREMVQRIENELEKQGVSVIGLIPYDSQIYYSTKALKPVVEYDCESSASIEIEKIYNRLKNMEV